VGAPRRLGAKAALSVALGPFVALAAICP